MPRPVARPRGWSTVLGHDRHATGAGLAPTLGRTMGEGRGRRGRTQTRAAWRASWICQVLSGPGVMTMTPTSAIGEMDPSAGTWVGKITSNSVALTALIVNDSDGEAARIPAVAGGAAGAVSVRLDTWDDLTVTALGSGILGATLILDIAR